MTEQELRQVLNTIHLMYKNSFVDLENRQRADTYVEIYKRNLSDLEYQDVSKAVDTYIQENETNFAPTVHQIRYLAEKERNKRLKKDGNYVYRVETPEEVRCQMWHELMKKENKTDDDFYWLEQWKKDVELFEGEEHEERFKKHFGYYPKEYYERFN